MRIQERPEPPTKPQEPRQPEVAPAIGGKSKAPQQRGAATRGQPKQAASKGPSTSTRWPITLGGREFQRQEEMFHFFGLMLSSSADRVPLAAPDQQALLDLVTQAHPVRR